MSDNTLKFLVAVIAAAVLMHFVAQAKIVGVAREETKQLMIEKGDSDVPTD